MSNVTASQLAASSLREYLLATLPAQVTAKNLTRAATLTTPQAGPWTIPASGSISVTLNGTDYTACALTSGSQTAAQLASTVNTAMGATVASALTDGRLRLTSTTPPVSPSTNSVIGIAADASGAAAILGFDAAGEMQTRAPLVAPTNAGIMDGEPQVMPPFSAGRMVVILRDREDAEVQLRRDERLATLEMLVYVPLATQNYHADREEIQAACACILNVLATTSGRQFARTSTNDVGFTSVKQVKVSGSQWGVKNDLNILLDIARLVVTARVFQLAAL